MKSRIILATLLGAIVVGANAAADSANLHLRAKAGDTFKYKMGVSIDIQGVSIEIAGKITDKYTKVDDKATKLDSEFTDFEMTVMGEKSKQDDGVATYEILPSGQVATLKYDEKNEGMTGTLAPLKAFVNLISSKRDVAVGTKWTEMMKNIVINEEGDKNEDASTCDYELLALEDVDKTKCAKVSIKLVAVSEKDRVLTGNIWVDLSNGVLVKFDGQTTMKSEEMGEMVMKFNITKTE